MPSISTPEQAIARANQLTRLERNFGAPAATLTAVTNDVTPYLGEENARKHAWQVVYPPGRLALSGSRGAGPDAYVRTFKVVLDTASGTLLFLTSTYQGPPDPNMLPMPSCDAATVQLVNEEEVYNGYPSQDPRIDFIAALESIQNEGIGSPLQAKEIHAVYVLHSRMGLDPSPAWAITLRGLPPFAAHGPNPKSI